MSQYECASCGWAGDHEGGPCPECGFDGGEGPVISLPTLVPITPEVATELVNLIRQEAAVGEMDLSTVIPEGSGIEYYRGLATGLIACAQVAERYLEPEADAPQPRRAAWLMAQADIGLLQFAAMLRYQDPEADELKPKSEPV